MTQITILHEDESLLAVDKPAGLPVHGSSVRDETVESVLRRQLGGRATRMGFTISAVHRLDRDTSGVLLLARRKRACRRLMEQFAAHAVEKRYLALVLRGPAEEAVVLDAPLADLDRPKGPRQEARTEVTVLARAGELALVEARPLTGRTHQIRRHLAQAGCPLAGDPRYGSDRLNAFVAESFGLGRIFLHARRISLAHPDGGESLSIESALPDELVQVVVRAGLRAATSP